MMKRFLARRDREWADGGAEESEREDPYGKTIADMCLGPSHLE